MAVGILSKAGYEVIASTGKDDAAGFLKSLGASDVVDREFVNDDSSRPLMKPKWAGAIDTVGGNTLATLLITPENSPINMSPWYAFKLWSESPQTLYVKLTYPENAYHRYYPKMSRDGLTWGEVDSSRIFSTRVELDGEEVDKDLTINLSLGPDTLWISAQELITNTHVEQWIRELETNSFVKRSSIGSTHEGRSLDVLKIGESDDQRMMMVLSRQHPPEIPGFLAMQAFVETLCASTEVAEAFRSSFNVYVLPMVNPDGVFHGHWRHNRGGVDLNRDWQEFNQPETSAIRDFMNQKTGEGKGKFYFSVDFHSTFQDIYYTIDPSLEGNQPGLVPELIEASAKELPGYHPNVRPNSAQEARITSTSFLFYEMGAEALTYEIGDRTPREFIRQKGEVTATRLMELLLEK